VDHYGGMPGMRMVVDTIAALSAAGRQFRGRYCFQPMMRPGEMKRVFIDGGLRDVTETELMVRMDYQVLTISGADRGGEGPLGKFMGSLDADEHARIGSAVREAYLAGQPDGSRSFANIAWAVRGVYPDCHRQSGDCSEFPTRV
jgi:hypothetical protein